MSGLGMGESIQEKVLNEIFHYPINRIPTCRPSGGFATNISRGNNTNYRTHFQFFFSLLIMDIS